MSEQATRTVDAGKAEAFTEDKGMSLGSMILVMGIVFLATMGFMLLYKVERQMRDYDADVIATVADPAYGALAAKAGYRVEMGILNDVVRVNRWVVARCVRANEAGPLPCDPAPRPAGDVGKRMQVIPPDAGQSARVQG